MKLTRTVVLNIELDYDESSVSEEEASSVISQCINQGIDKAYNWSYDYEDVDSFSITESWE